MKRSFFQAAVVSILQYGCTTWTPTKRLEKKLDGNYTRMLWAILNKSWRQHPTRHQLYGQLPPITKTIQARRNRHAGHCWRSKDELISDVLLTIRRSGERGSGISVLAARHDDNDDELKECKKVEEICCSSDFSKKPLWKLPWKTCMNKIIINSCLFSYSVTRIFIWC